MRKVYISGKITGLKESEARRLFKEAKYRLISQGYSVVNPMDLPEPDEPDWHTYMRQDIAQMCNCQAIYMLSNWRDSKGAIIEHSTALHLGLEVMYQDGPISAQEAIRCIYSQMMDGGGVITKDWIGWEGFKKMYPGAFEGLSEEPQCQHQWEKITEMTPFDAVDYICKICEATPDD